MAGKKPGMDKGDPRAKKFGDMGGEICKEQMTQEDPEYYSKIGKLGGAANKAKGSEYFARIGAKGGAANAAKGPGYFSRIAKEGWARRKAEQENGRG